MAPDIKTRDFDNLQMAKSRCIETDRATEVFDHAEMGHLLVHDGWGKHVWNLQKMQSLSRNCGY